MKNELIIICSRVCDFPVVENKNNSWNKKFMKKRKTITRKKKSTRIFPMRDFFLPGKFQPPVLFYLIFSHFPDNFHFYIFVVEEIYSNYNFPSLSFHFTPAARTRKLFNPTKNFLSFYRFLFFFCSHSRRESRVQGHRIIL